ncbi:MAG: MraY family glycosyltransferase [Microgenomates group bacterium]
MEFILAFGIAACISYLLTPPTIYFATRFGLVTDSKVRKHPAHTHVGIIPRGGGIPLFIGFLITSLLFVTLNKLYIGIIIASTLTVIIGVLDDYYDISPYLRFGINLLISGLVIGFGLGIPFISNPFGEAIRLDTWRITFELFGKHSVLPFADILALIWLTWITNMINWSKGVDGQMPGFVAVAALFLGILSQRFIAHDVSTSNVMFFAFIISGVFIGFLPFNFYPQKIMPGYGGGALAGFWLGVLSILSFGKIGTFIVVLAIPMIDAIYTLIRRIKKGVSPFKADRGHFHHRLMELGWGKRRIAVFYWFITGILGCASLFLSGIEKLIAFMIVAVLLALFFFIIDKKQRS